MENHTDNQTITISNINKAEAARYLGYRDSLPDVAMTKQILMAEKELLAVIEPRFCYKVFDIEEEESGIRLIGTEFVLEGTSIKEHLADCEKAVVMAATLSEGVDKLLRQNEIGNMLNAMILDALSNAAIEQVCDAAEEIIFSNMPDCSHTWRFGIGYGDFPLTQQHMLLEVLQAGKRIGLCATESCILTPRKSVTCIMGVSTKELGERKKTCKHCQLMEKCEFKRRGTTCYL